MAGEYLLNYRARKYYTGNGSQKDFLITFPGGNPIETNHVKVFVNGTELTTAWSVVGYGGNNYVRFDTAPNGASAGNVLLKRVTPDTEETRVVDFTGGSLLKAEDLDRSQLNCLYVSQESADLFLDQGGTAVNTTFDQSIAGVKTFTGSVNITNAANLIFKPGTIPLNLIGGKQYVLAASDSSGTVGWEETLLQTLPDNVVLTDGPVEGQDILTNKKFSGQVEFGNAVKITVGAETAKVLTSDGAGNASWAKAVNGVRLGSSTALIKDGIVTITAADIGVLGGVAVDANGVSQVTGPVDFDGSISVGDAGLDNLVINASIKIPTNAGAGKVLTSNNDGYCAWNTPIKYITSVNEDSGASTNGAITITAASLNAVSTNTTQDITGIKSFKESVNLGNNPANQTVTIGALLKYPVNMSAGGTQQEGQVLTSTADGTCVWQVPEPAGVLSLNDGVGHLTISATSLGALTTATLPVCDAQTAGVVKMGSGLYMSSGGVLNVQTGGTFPIATRFDATTPTIGGFTVGDNLTINATTGRLDAMTGSGATQVTSLSGLTGAVTTSQLYNTIGLVGKAVGQVFTGSNAFTKTIKLYPTISTGVSSNGGYGINLNSESGSTDTTTHGCVSVQNEVSTNDVFRGYSSTGGITSRITGQGNAYFAGTVEAVAGFKTTGGMSIGDNLIDGITLNGTLKIPAGASDGYVLRCTGDTDPVTGGLIGKAVWSNFTAAPVQSVNTRTGAVVITADGVGTGIGAVTKDTIQEISGKKTFSAEAVFNNAVTLGNDLQDFITVGGTMKIAQDAFAGKVLTCGATGGTVAWQPPLITSVITKIGTTITETQVGEVIIDAAKIGAATTAQLNTATAAIATAQTTANNAATAAATAQSTADSKLAAVSITTTANPTGGAALDCLTGNGTETSKLKVLGAPPLGGVPTGGDLTGSYPIPTIGAGKVTYAKMQTVAAQRLLGNATSAAANVTEIQLGSGLTWTSGALDTVNKGDAVLSAANLFTNTTGNTFAGTTTCAALTTTGSVILGDAAADTVTVNATPTFKTDVTLDAGKKIVTHGFNMTDSKGDGLVLTCDANGNGTWKASAASTTTGSTSAFVYYTGGGGWSSATFGAVKATGCPHTISVSGYNPPVVTLTGVAGQTWQAVMGGGGVSSNLSWTSLFGVATLSGATPVTTSLTVKGYSALSAGGGYGFTITFHRTA